MGNSASGGKRKKGSNGPEKSEPKADYSSKSIGVSSLSSIIEITVACKNLAADGYIYINAFCVASLSSSSTAHRWMEIGRTERIARDNNPTFTHKILLEYYFEEIQKIKFEILTTPDDDIYSADTSALLVKSLLCLGTVETTLSSIFSTKKLCWSSNLTQSIGAISVMAKEMPYSGAKITMNLRCSKLDQVESFKKNDSFLLFSKRLEEKRFSPCFQTEVKFKDQEPVFAEIKGTVLHFGHGDMSNMIKIGAYHYSPYGNIIIGKEFYAKLYTTPQKPLRRVFYSY